MNAPLSNPRTRLLDNHRNPRPTQEAGHSPVVPDTGIGSDCGMGGRCAVAGKFNEMEMGWECR